MRYEWDEEKRQLNKAKHGHDLADGDLVYESPGKLTIDSHRHDEQRWLDIAVVNNQLLTLTLAYTVRGDVVRFISLRKASRKERRQYNGQNS